ncbi:hypothetical protein CONLIGDRAFT_63525 [Coniochaeta ligniaria NRRL 30616]|uniref:Yippee/Mis18/Cereblon domain-containing protein n=1 Tax=Coniochaeta ligniaria NRRL 30616 TaxID=1408157 RepID=A0A1J7J806_9PEZI|nr:hypothetical protein CONLIGDRAFT_63525 [Coniochaeta ligniaria NRRL 30616]
METVTFTCKTCDSSIGEFANLWTQIGKSYFSPIVDPQRGPDIRSHGPLRSGEKGTLVEGCQLQDIACMSCGAVLGIRCSSTPVNHVLDENQILFRITTVQPLSQADGREVDLVVKRYLKLRETSRASTEKPMNGASAGLYDESSPGAGTAELSLLHAELEAQRSDIERIDSAGFKVISGLDDAVNRVEGDLGKMRDTLSELRRELRGNHDDMSSLKTEIKDVKKQSQDRTVVKRLEAQLNSANDTVETLRHELNDLASKFANELDSVKASLRQNTKEVEDIKSVVRDRVSTRDHAKDMASVRGELAQLRKQMDDSRAKPPGPFPSRELDILTSNIAKIGNRASLVESLQMEFEIFKGRLERMEAASQARQAPVPSAETTSAYDRYDDHDYHANEPRSSRRKRPSSGLDTSPLPDSSSKRAATSSDAADTITATQWSQNTPSSPVTEARTRADPTRLTKSGKVDKRAARPARRSLVGISTDGKPPHTKRRG